MDLGVASADDREAALVVDRLEAEAVAVEADRGHDILIVDTAGRLHTKQGLMDGGAHSRNLLGDAQSSHLRSSL